MGGTIYWYGAGTEILDESNTSGTITNEYVFFGGKRVAMRAVSSGTIYYYEEDMLGSSRTMVQAGQASVCYDADFYPFGGERDITNTCTQHYKFEGKERDTETGNDDFGARYYTSRLGRWLSADWSAVPAPVPYANLTNPQTLNLYAMVSDNPETFADLDGHASGNMGQCDQLVDVCTGGAVDAGGLVGDGPPAQPNNGTGTPQQINVKLNVIWDEDAHLTKKDKDKFKTMLKETEGLYGKIGIHFKVTYTTGVRVTDMGGYDVNIEGAEKGALNVLVSDILTVAERGATGDNGASGIVNGSRVSFIGMVDAKDWFLSHEVAHQFLGDPVHPPGYFSNAFRDVYINRFVLPHIASHADELRKGALDFAGP